MSLRLLCLGDLHLGRRPTGLPADAGELVREGAPEAALARAVEAAIAERVDALVFAGDVVDSMNARFEAIPPLRAAVARLREAEIEAVAVVGNHDVEALPAVASSVEGLRLLGAGGRWSLHTVESADGTRAHLLGWSFPRPRVSTSPFVESPDLPGDGVPVIGVLHCDLDAPSSVYAPVARHELEACGADAWLLGHIHVPTLEPGGRPFGYLGSVTPLDPGELGARGPWLCEVSPGVEPRLERLPGAALRFEELAVSVDGIHDAERELFASIGSSASALIEDLGPELDRVIGLGLRVVLRGRSSRVAELDAAAEEILGDESLTMAEAGLTWFVESVRLEVAVAHDLRALADGDDPPALIARDLLALDQPGPGREALLAEARARLEASSSASAFRRLEPEVLDDARVADLLRRGGMLALDGLLAQRAGR